MKTSKMTKYIGALALSLASLILTAKADERDPGVLYTMDNASSGNKVLVIQHTGNDQFGVSASFATGGNGTGSSPGLPSQGSILLSRDGQWLFVCNAGGAP